MPPSERKNKPSITIREYAARWLEEIRGRERKSYVRKARSYTNNVILPFWTDTPLELLTTDRLLEFRDHVLSRTRLRRDPESGELVSVPITTKTARNIVTGYFRAIIVAAMERHRVPAADPFPLELRWSKKRGAAMVSHKRAARPNPFTAEERDTILDWYLRSDRFWYPFLYFQFWTGCRPSETIALRQADVDLAAGTVTIDKSRDEGEESEPKTRQSDRTISLYPNVVVVLRTVRPARMHPQPDEYFFTEKNGDPSIRATGRWTTASTTCFVASGSDSESSTPRVTRRSHGSSLQGANPFGVAKYHGTSLAMIDAHYGKWIPAKGLDPAVLRALDQYEKRDLERNLLAVFVSCIAMPRCAA